MLQLKCSVHAKMHSTNPPPRIRRPAFLLGTSTLEFRSQSPRLIVRRHWRLSRAPKAATIARVHAAREQATNCRNASRLPCCAGCSRLSCGLELKLQASSAACIPRYTRRILSFGRNIPLSCLARRLRSFVRGRCAYVALSHVETGVHSGPDGGHGCTALTL